MSIGARVRPGSGPLAGRTLPWVCLAAALVMFAAVMMAAAARGRGYDLAPLAAAGRLVSAGQTEHLYAQDPEFYNLVQDPVYRRAASNTGFAGEVTPFVYPPLVAALMQPAARIPFPRLARIWAAVSTVLVLYGVSLTLAAYLPAWQTPWTWTILLLALCRFEPILYAFWLGQTTAMIYPLVIGAVVLQRRGRLAMAGVALALATFIKLTPVALALVWLWRGPRSAVGWCLLTLGALWSVSLLTLGVDVHGEYIHRLVSIGRAVLVTYNNHSLLAFVSRFGLEPAARLDWRMHQPAPMAVAVNTALLAAGATAMFASVRRIPASASERWRPCAEGFVWIVILLAPGIAWTHYFVFLLPVIAIVIAQGPRPSILPGMLAGTSFLLCCRPVLAPQDIPPSAIGPLALAGPTLAAAILGIGTIWVARQHVRLGAGHAGS